jgi:hypothetical protein
MFLSQMVAQSSEMGACVRPHFQPPPIVRLARTDDDVSVMEHVLHNLHAGRERRGTSAEMQSRIGTFGAAASEKVSAPSLLI